MKVSFKSHQLLYLPKNAAALKLTYMQNYLQKPQELGAQITAIQLMKLSEKMK